MKWTVEPSPEVFASWGLPVPEKEWHFHEERQWRWDYAWPTPLLCQWFFTAPNFYSGGVALEKQGGIWMGKGGHQRLGAVRDMEKFSEGAVLGWIIVLAQPQDIWSEATLDRVKRGIERIRTMQGLIAGLKPRKDGE